MAGIGMAVLRARHRIFEHSDASFHRQELTMSLDAAHEPNAVDRLRRPGRSLPVQPSDMAGRVADFQALAPDPGAFPDIKDKDHARQVWYLLSPEGLAGLPSPIRAKHGFHMAVMRMPRGSRPSTHAHPYNEVFMPLDARFRFYYGDDERFSVDVGRYGVISVPAGVMRTFENLDDHDAHMLVIFDTPGDPHVDMRIAERDFERFYKDGWLPGVEPKG